MSGPDQGPLKQKSSPLNLQRRAEQLKGHVKAQPNDVASWVALGKTLLKLKEPQAARQILNDGFEYNPHSGGIAAALAAACMAGGDVSAAQTWYATAASLAPDDLKVLRDAAGFWEKRNDFAHAAALADAVLERKPGDAFAMVMKARSLRRTGDVAAALAVLDSRDPAKSDGDSLFAFFMEKGRCLDSLGCQDDAYTAFVKGQAVRARANPDWPMLKEKAITIVRHETEMLSKMAGQDRMSTPHFGKAPVFLVGFPRSGTTLLDTVLDAHPRITVLSERSPIERLQSERIRKERATGGQDYLESAAVETMRNQYWRYFDDQIGPRPDGILVDKLPLNLVSIRTIHTLFPSAKIIFAARHPCDVCLSNFTQPFALNMFLAHFLSLEDTAAFYATCMTLWALAQNVLPLSVHEVRYEDVVDDFENTIGALLTFLNVPWDDAVTQFHSHARDRAIVTPSYEQVSKPIYTASRGRWHNYRNAMEPVLPTLRPFIDAFGYSEAEDSAP